MMDRKSRQGRGGRPMTGFRIRNRYKPTTEGVDKGRLVPGNYVGFDGENVPYFEYIEHFNATVYKGHICSRIWKETLEGELEGSGKCISCREIEDGARNISFRRMAGFLWLHYDWYYMIPAEDDKGNVLTYQRDSKYHKKGDVIFNRIHEEQAIKEYGRAAIRRNEWERVFGNLMHWSLGTNHLLVLSAKIDDLERDCQCGGHIETLLWECPNKDCGAEVFDLTDDGDCDYSRNEVAQMVIKPCKCPRCGKTDFLVPVRDCDSCKNPKPLQLWDVDLEVSREGEGTQTQLIIRRHHHRPVDERCADLIPERDILHRVFAGDSLEYQAKAMKVQNPWKSEETRRHVQDYDKDQSGADGDAVDDDIPV